MRTLERNKSVFLYCNYESDSMLLDEHGLFTGEHDVQRSKPVSAKGYISGAKGDAESVEFGTDVLYDKTIILAGTKWDIGENTMLYIDDLDTTKAPDYKVVRVAKYLNHTTLAIAKVAR